MFRELKKVENHCLGKLDDHLSRHSAVDCKRLVVEETLLEEIFHLGPVKVRLLWPRK